MSSEYDKVENKAIDAEEGSSGTSKDNPFDSSADAEEAKGERSASDEDVTKESKAKYDRRISKLDNLNKFQNELDRVTLDAKKKQMLATTEDQIKEAPD